ncbi:unannotated protein [freshwater metagenome]|uniref:Unannotated protein n=1 Tax=freshwater metagenome TaxID=449393 RepID=A0A6J7EPJ2_9ZZZZ
MFALAAMTYVEGSSLHQDRGGSTVFARYAFNEFWSFVAGWAVMLDYVILVAATAFAATNYLAAFWAPFGRGTVEILTMLGILLYVAARNIRGFSSARQGRIGLLVLADLALQVLLIVLGVVLLFDGPAITSSIHLGSTPTVDDLIVAFGIATVVSTGLESASGLAGEVGVGRRGLARLVSASSLTVMVVYVGIALVALSAMPVINGTTTLATTFRDAPILGIADAFHQAWLRDTLRYVIAAMASVTLIAASNSAMLGLSRLGYSLSTNRQVPAALGRLHPTRFTPWVLIIFATVGAAALAIPRDLDFLLGLYAFGALLGLTIAHVSIVKLRFTEPDRSRPYVIPLGVRIGRARLPLPAVLGVLLSVAAWLSVVITHDSARWVGIGWMGFGVAFYVGYRLLSGKSLTQRVTVPREALLGEHVEVEYGTILVPIFGTPLDDDIVQTAGRLASEEGAEAGELATIEAVWIFEVPMSLPIDARLPDAELQRARAALARAKSIGEEYDGVEVATATVRGRSLGHTIVEEARRRGVQAIVLAADEPSRIRGGARLGGRQAETFIGEATKTVIARAHCAVILTAPPVGDRGLASEGAEQDPAEPPER